MPYISQNGIPRGPKGKAGSRGATGYNATGAAQDLDTLRSYVEQDAGPNPFAEALTGSFVVFRDQNGDPLPPGSVTTIKVNTTTGEIDDITFQEA